jgi:hypothetical protein
MFFSHGEKELYTNIIEKLFIISGFPIDAIPEAKKLLETQGTDGIIKQLFIEIKILKLEDIDQSERICLIDTAVKAGNLDLVKAIAEKFIAEKFSDDIRIPSENNMEEPYRPVFWLASIVTRQAGVDKSHYQAIEDYLCNRFEIPNTVQLPSEDKKTMVTVSRKEYLTYIEAWKHTENIRLLVEDKVRKPRYCRHQLLDEIEKGLALKKTPRK